MRASISTLGWVYRKEGRVSTRCCTVKPLRHNANTSCQGVTTKPEYIDTQRQNKNRSGATQQRRNKKVHCGPAHGRLWRSTANKLPLSSRPTVKSPVTPRSTRASRMQRSRECSDSLTKTVWAVARKSDQNVPTNCMGKASRVAA